MRLAGHLGWPSIREGLAKNSSRDIEEWFAFGRIEPYGDEWRQSASIASLIAAAHGAKNVKIEDFMPIRRQQDPHEVFGVFEMLHDWMKG